MSTQAARDALAEIHRRRTGGPKHTWNPQDEKGRDTDTHRKSFESEDNDACTDSEDSDALSDYDELPRQSTSGNKKAPFKPVNGGTRLKREKSISTYVREMHSTEKPKKKVKLSKTFFDDIDCLTDPAAAGAMQLGNRLKDYSDGEAGTSTKENRTRLHYAGYESHKKPAKTPQYYGLQEKDVHVTDADDGDSEEITDVKTEPDSMLQQRSEMRGLKREAEENAAASELNSSPVIAKDAFYVPDTAKYVHNKELSARRMMELKQASNLDESLEPASSSSSNMFEEKLKTDNMGITEALPFYFLDAWEDSAAGVVYLFGKVHKSSLPTSSKRTTKSFVSCCVVIEKMMCDLFFKLPEIEASGMEDGQVKEMEKVTVKAAIDELSAIRRKRGIAKCEYKAVKRNYAFEKSGMKRGNGLRFLKMKIPADGPQFLESDLSGEAFTHCFGRNVSLVERVLVKCSIMGPSWLKISSATIRSTHKSWCKYEVSVDSYKSIKPWNAKSKVEGGKTNEAPKNIDTSPTTPPFTIMSIHVKTMPSIDTQNEIISIALIWLVETDISKPQINNNGIRRFIGTRKPGENWPRGFQDLCEESNIIMFDSEHKLISEMIDFIEVIDPDILVGHNIFGEDLEVFRARCHALKVDTWHKLSRLRRPNSKISAGSKTGSGFWNGRYFTVGRLVCDSYLEAKELSKARANYRIEELMKEYRPEIWKEKEDERNAAIQESSFNKESTQLHNNLLILVTEAEFCLHILWHLQALPLTKELSNISGNLWSRSLQNARSERVDYLLLHSFHKEKYVCPDPKLQKMAFGKIRDVELDSALMDEKDIDEEVPSSSHKAAYSGGLVLEPKAGLYDTFVLLLDFNSLYPSIIQEFNVCFTTVERPDETEKDAFVVTNVSDEKGLLPEVVKRLINRRKAVKAALKDEADVTKRATLEIRQKAIKLVANSLYGCLGSSISRFYAKPIAAYITQKGRTILQSTKSLVENDFRSEIIYGDTDSIMVNTGFMDDGKGIAFKDATKLANAIKSAVNKLYKQLEIDLEAIFRRLLLLKKKKYAFVKLLSYEENKFEMGEKGLDLVRRDWCGLAKDAGYSILHNVIFMDCHKGNEALDSMVSSIHDILSSIKDAMESSKIDLKAYIITKSVTKSLHLYADKKGHPHVQVAHRLAAAGTQIRPGNEIEYIICAPPASLDDTETTATTENARTSDALPPWILGHLQSKDWSERAFSPAEVKRWGLQPDCNWYKTQQLLPVLTRLCGQIDGTDAARLAEFLGIDASKYASREGDRTESFKIAIENADLSKLRSTAERFKDYQLELNLKCLYCESKITVEAALRHMKCTECKKWIPISSLRNWLCHFLHSEKRKQQHHSRHCGACGRVVQSVRFRNSEKCPNLLCQSEEVIPFITPAERIHSDLEYLKYLLSCNLSEIGDEDTEKSCSSSVDIAISSDATCNTLIKSDIRHELTTFEDLCAKANAAVASASKVSGQYPFVRAFFQSIEKNTCGIGRLDYEKERMFLKGMIDEALRTNAYSNLLLKDLLEVFTLPTEWH